MGLETITDAGRPARSSYRRDGQTTYCSAVAVDLSGEIENSFDVERLKGQVEESLRARFEHCASAQELSEIAQTAVDHYEAAAVRNYLPILAQRRANRIAAERYSAAAASPIPARDYSYPRL